MTGTKLLWFTLGFLFKGVLDDGSYYKSKHKVDALDTRISKLEQCLPSSSSPHQKIEIEEESTKEKKRIQRFSLGEDVKAEEYHSLLGYISLSCGDSDKRICLCDPSGESIHLFDKDS